jgi:hypothetical protein
MRLQVFAIIFMSFWMGIVGLISITILIVGLSQIEQVFKQGFSPVILIPFGMFIFGYGIMTIGFKSESKNSKRFLASLFNGQEETEHKT